jgi:hypothetical protein
MSTSPQWLLVFVLSATLSTGRAAPTDPVPALGPNSFGLTYTPMPPAFKFQPAATIEGWIQQDDSKPMIEHGWEIWGGLTTMTSQVVDGKPVKAATFETWVDESTVFPTPSALAAVARAAVTPGAKARQFGLPRQLQHQQAALRTAAAASFKTLIRVVSVKYTKEIYDHVQTNGYYKTATMQALNASWDKKGTPLADRVVLPFPNNSIMLKPTYAVVSGSAATLLPYWTGPSDSSNPSAPDIASWNKKMLVVPPGAATPKVNDIPAVGIDQFYAIKLNKEEAAAITSLGQGTANEGDYAILVAMHVSSREIDNWTWQTFWWSFEKPTIPKSVQPAVVAPFDHYNIAVGNSFTTGPDSPEGLNVVCYNPYLEAGFDQSTFGTPGQRGIESNCMSCHRTAAWPPPTNANNAPYFTGNGLVKPGDSYFKGTTKVDFLWGFALDVNPPPTPTPTP